MLASIHRRVSRLVPSLVAKVHNKPFNSELYAEKFVLSHELFQTKGETLQPPLVIMHGLLGSKSNWRSVAKNFSRNGRHVLTLDLRNHGHSPHSSFMSYEIMANDVSHTLTKVVHDHPKFDLLGHSMGGKVAMLLALKHPELIKRLIVVDILPSGTESAGAASVNAIFQALGEVTLNTLKSVSDARQNVVTQLLTKIPNKGVCDWLATNVDWTPERGIYWRCNIPALRTNADDILRFPELTYKAFTKPVLFIQGEKSDHMNVPNRDEIIKRYFPKAEVSVISGAGHWVHSEKPFDFIRAVESFLSVPVAT